MSTILLMFYCTRKKPPFWAVFPSLFIYTYFYEIFFQILIPQYYPF